MMMNLFSTFDPCTGKFSMNWMSMMMFLMIMPSMFWMLKNNQMMLTYMLFKMINKEIMMNSKYKSISIIMMSMMMLIMINNMMGLLPYVFTATSHMSISISMSLPIWMSYMIYGWTKNNKMMMANLLPKNSPTLIMPFMIMIELVSNIIRPISLSVRLSANMIAGHLLFTLMGEKNMIMMMSIMLIMMIFEMAVSIIQSYVFMTLMSLYSSEV
uniref:ATP synthase subunit a n=1 Tax=Trocnadella arisana TaxID=1437250 RepID=A0A342KAG3_9HEMI|nr:ATP synthase F0 subunit 6 [Trocnadella arisana]AMY96197.1 ATP synthase F0 subunit 6 [Trocnadella arisana]